MLNKNLLLTGIFAGWLTLSSCVDNQEIASWMEDTKAQTESIMTYEELAELCAWKSFITCDNLYPGALKTIEKETGMNFSNIDEKNLWDDEIIFMWSFPWKIEDEIFNWYYEVDEVKSWVNAVELLLKDSKLRTDLSVLAYRSEIDWVFEVSDSNFDYCPKEYCLQEWDEWYKEYDSIFEQANNMKNKYSNMFMIISDIVRRETNLTEIDPDNISYDSTPDTEEVLLKILQRFSDWGFSDLVDQDLLSSSKK